MQSRTSLTQTTLHQVLKTSTNHLAAILWLKPHPLFNEFSIITALSQWTPMHTGKSFSAKMEPPQAKKTQKQPGYLSLALEPGHLLLSSPLCWHRA